ncbi:MAG: DUF1015 domain-containing protein [Candidatus Firestonebacteria bacterium]
MVKIIPFKGYRFNENKLDLRKVVSLPYDVITPSMQSKYYNLSPYNIVRIILRKDNNENKYKKAKRTLDEWIKKKIFIQDGYPGFYLHEQKFIMDGKNNSRIGLICLVKLEDFKKKKILPHENTFSTHKKDRLKLLKECKANLSPIFGLYDGGLDFNNTLKRKPFLKFNIEDKLGRVVNKVWKVENVETIKNIINIMANKRIFIADGHHRYEVALAFKKKMGKVCKNVQEVWNYIMFSLVSIKDKGLKILPTHRVVKFVHRVGFDEIKKKLSKDFYIKEIKSKDVHKNIVMYVNKRYYRLSLKNEISLKKIKTKNSLKWRKLPTAVLHYIILKTLPKSKEIFYTVDEKEVIKKVNSGDFNIGFLLPGITAKDVRDIAFRLERMPPKTTYFYPKVPTGIVINKF